MVNMHREKSSGPKYQMGKLGIHDNPAIARKTKSVMMPHRTNLFPGWDLKISQNAQIVPSPITIARIMANAFIVPWDSSRGCPTFS